MVVPEVPDGHTDRPLDIGTREMRIRPRVGVGQMAPAIVVKTVDGRPFSLEALRGKFVLLDFWANSCGHCIEELPNLRDASQLFGCDPRFALVSLSLDDKPETARRFAGEHGMPWTQIFLGPWGDSKVADDFGVQAIPSIWLIGPDGRLVARDLSGRSIRAKIAERLPPQFNSRPPSNRPQRSV